MNRYLTKSRLKLALECETKLFYTGKPEYPNQKNDDPFLASLAEGGFQVGELARRYHPGGILIGDRGYDQPLKLTDEFLEREKVILYEAAFRHENLFIRTDVLVKNGNAINLIEVKAKSFVGKVESDFLNAKGGIEPKWLPFLYDIAFQKHLLVKAYPGFNIQAWLMLADKNAVASVDGLNQRFLVKKGINGSPEIKVSGNVSEKALGNWVLRKINVDGLVDKIFDGTERAGLLGMAFQEYVDFLSDNYLKDIRVVTPLGARCRGCEFQCNGEERISGKKDGFRECWKKVACFKDRDFERPLLLDVWDYRKKEKLISEGKYFMDEMSPGDLGKSNPHASGMSHVERQQYQIQKAVTGDNEMVLLADDLKEEMNLWKFPLHFIDFETSAVAIPFYKGMKPYEGIAFQFSHHTVDAQGKIIHAGQFLNAEQGKFPNFDFIRSLKKELENDEGSIFRYSHHENNYLNAIHDQLMQTDPTVIPDRDELCRFIRSITHSTKKKADKWDGPRDMIDLCEMVKRFYYDPYMGSSNSIKKVLPAILNRSKYLQDKYSKPVYGTINIPSLNFTDQIWISKDNQCITNPYDLLPPLFEGFEDEEMEQFLAEPTLADGGAALMAYAKMQFSQITKSERDLIGNGLLRYCELDTFAMVLIYEFFKHETDSV